MSIDKTFKEAVQDGDIQLVRIILKNSIIMDTTFKDFDEMISYAQDMPGLYEEFDNQPLSHDETSWDDDYLADLMGELTDNFSHERINHLKKVASKLRPATPISQIDSVSNSKSTTPTKKTRNNQAQRIIREKRSATIPQSKQKKVVICATGGAILGAGTGAIVGLATVPTAVTFGALGAVVGGAIGVLLDMS